MSIQERLQKFPVPDTVWDEYHIDQEINDRGVAIDLPLVRQAIDMDARSRAELTDKELGLSVTTRIVRREYNLQEPWNTVLELSTTLKNLDSSGIPQCHECGR